MNKEAIPKVYNPQQVEGRIYDFWEKSGFFKPSAVSRKPSAVSSKYFSIVIPPPNITGNLHMGHALNNTLQDIMVRFRRMQGFSTLWLPGTDHAGIATQNTVEKALAKEGKHKENIGRKAFIERVWQWKEQYGSNIVNQLKRIGSSCDWSRLRFTMDEDLSKAVRRAFVILYNKGYIYKGQRIINWCPRCLTALSDIEVEHETIPSKLWYIRYPLADIPAEYIVVATTRPETMLGDTAVAVNPKDKRYKSLVGKLLTLPLVNRIIPLIADEFVDTAFGTGAVKVTPAHDPNDFEIGLRHNLPRPEVIAANGKIDTKDIAAIPGAEIKKYAGLDRFAARKEIVGDLEALGLMEKIEDYELNHGKCYRCKNVIEPYLSDQWFVKMAELAKPAIQAIEKKKIKFNPNRWTKVYLDWMNNIRDWCISRQIWWGHQIPVWYCPDGHLTVAEDDPSACATCGKKELTQDPDVLDTWFSSSLWPFSTMGWPDFVETSSGKPVKDSDLEKFYPTSVLITGYDIIFFWVARMIFMGMEFMKEKPFSDVYITGLIRDITGKKMSKSLGNVIDPIDIINHSGADALRFALTSLITAQGQDLKLSEDKVLEARNFANKIWNVARFVLMNLPEEKFSVNLPNPKQLSPVDRWILSRYHTCVAATTQLLEVYDFGSTARRLYEFIWSEFCDWYIEMSKGNLYGNDLAVKANTQAVLYHILCGVLKLLHPFMPFITEELWNKVKQKDTDPALMISAWPELDKSRIDLKLEKEFEIIIELIRAIRNIRSEMNVPAGKEADLIVISKEREALLKSFLPHIKSLTKAGRIEVKSALKTPPKEAAQAVISGIQVFIPLSGLIDIGKELARLKNEAAKMQQEIERLKAKFANKNFIHKAPPELIAAERAKEKAYRDKQQMILEQIKNIG